MRGTGILGLALELQSVRKRFFVCTDEAGKVLNIARKISNCGGEVFRGVGIAKKKMITFMKSCPSSVFSFSMVEAGPARYDPSPENSEDGSLSRYSQEKSTLCWCDPSCDGKEGVA